MKWRWLPLSTSSEDGDRLDLRALDALAAAIEDLDARAAQHGPVALLEVGDGVGERGERDGVGAEIHLARAVTDGERAALARGDHQVVVAGENDGEREGALQAAERMASRPLPDRTPFDSSSATTCTITSVSVSLSNT